MGNALASAQFLVVREGWRTRSERWSAVVIPWQFMVIQDMAGSATRVELRCVKNTREDTLRGQTSMDRGPQEPCTDRPTPKQTPTQADPLKGGHR
jgi:hypothetical protein